MEDRMRQQLLSRKRNGRLRTQLQVSDLEDRSPVGSSSYDFSSNDYIGLARSETQKKKVEEIYHSQKQTETPTLGATGSRLLSGDSAYARNLESWLSKIHNRPTATLFNSGYDANISLLSSIPLEEDYIIIDELCHNSLITGIKMSRRKQYLTFSHNNVAELEDQLQQINPLKRRNQCCLIVVESVYSMDGDIAPLKSILDLAKKFEAHVIVDEAHGLAVYGHNNPENLKVPSSHLSEFDDSKIHDREDNNNIGGTGVLAALELEQHPALFASIYTFGKGAGCHGAIICGSKVLQSYLWNYARPFIYSTALPLHSLVSIRASYETFISQEEGDQRRENVFKLVHYFRSILSKAILLSTKVSLYPSPSPVQALIVPGNFECIELCQKILNRYHIRLYPIRAPTVPKGEERVRIILHAHNTLDQVRYLCQGLITILQEMGLITRAKL